MQKTKFAMEAGASGSRCLLRLARALATEAQADVAYVSNGAAISVASGNMVNVPVPSGIQQDDILVVVVHSRDNVDSTMPGDWTLAVQGNGNVTNRIEVFWKRTTGVEDTPTVTHAAGDSAIARMHAFRGVVNAGSPFNVVGAVQSNAGSPISTAAITTTADLCMILHVFGSQDDNTCGTFAGIPITQAVQNANLNGTDNSLGMTYGIQPAAGSTGGAGATQTSGGPDPGASVLLALTPRAVSAPCNLTLAAVGNTTTLNVTNVGPEGLPQVNVSRLLTVGAGMFIAYQDTVLNLTRNGDPINVNTNNAIDKIIIHINPSALAAKQTVDFSTSVMVYSVWVSNPGGADWWQELRDVSRFLKDLKINSGVAMYGRSSDSTWLWEIGNDWICNSTGTATKPAFDGSNPNGNGLNSTITISGSYDSTRTIGGTQTTQFYNLTCALGGMTVDLDQNISIENDFKIDGGVFRTDGTVFSVTCTKNGDPLIVSPGSDVRNAAQITLDAVTAASYALNGVDAVLYHLLINDSTCTPDAALTVKGDLNVAGGTLAMAGNNLTIQGTTSVAGTLLASTAVIDATGRFTASGNVTFTADGQLKLRGGTVAAPNTLGTFTKSASKVFYMNLSSDETVYDAGVESYYQLEIDKGSYTATVAFNVTTSSVSDALTLVGGSTLDVSGTFNHTGLTSSFGAGGTGKLILRNTVTDLGTFTAGNGTVQYTAAVAQTVDTTAADYWNLTVGEDTEKNTATAARETFGSSTTTTSRSPRTRKPRRRTAR